MNRHQHIESFDNPRRRALVRWMVCFCLGLGFGMAEMSDLQAQSRALREYEIKAAYLYNFVKYTDWPEGALPPEGETLTIAVVGDNPFGPALAPLNGKSVKNRTLRVEEVSSSADLQKYPIVFISPSERERLPTILERLKESRSLTISEMESFAEQGGAINFFSERNKVRFEINVEAARRAGLNISSQLLKLARLTKT